MENNQKQSSGLANSSEQSNVYSKSIDQIFEKLNQLDMNRSYIVNIVVAIIFMLILVAAMFICLNKIILSELSNKTFVLLFFIVVCLLSCLIIYRYVCHLFLDNSETKKRIAHIINEMLNKESVIINQKSLNEKSALNQDLANHQVLLEKLKSQNDRAYISIANLLKVFVQQHKTGNRVEFVLQEYLCLQDIYRLLDESMSNKYDGDYAETLYDKASFIKDSYKTINDGVKYKKEAERSCKKALEIFKSLKKTNPEKWSDSVGKAELLLSEIKKL